MSDPADVVAVEAPKGVTLPLGVKVAGAVILVTALALALAWPILKAGDGTATRAAGRTAAVQGDPAGTDRSIEFGPEAVVQQTEAGVRSAETISVPGVALDRESEIASGTTGDKDWSLVLAAGEEMWCFTLRVAQGPENQGISCSEVGVGPPAGIPVIFVPSDRTGGLGRGVVVAALPTGTREVTLQATEDRAVQAALIQPATFFAGPPVMLVAFLPPRTDIVEATAMDSEGRDVDVDRLVDLTDEY